MWAGQGGTWAVAGWDPWSPGWDLRASYWDPRPFCLDPRGRSFGPSRYYPGPWRLRVPTLALPPGTRTAVGRDHHWCGFQPWLTQAWTLNNPHPDAGKGTWGFWERQCPVLKGEGLYPWARKNMGGVAMQPDPTVPETS